MRSPLLLAGFAALAAAAVLADPADQRCVKLEFGSAQETGGKKAEIFSATTTVDLTITAVFKEKFAGDHLLQLKVYTPDGFLYRSMAVPVTTSGKATTERKVEGYRHPQKVKATRTHGQFQAVDVVLPVAGTDIVSSGLYGTWKVQATIDELPNPCGDGWFFTLAQ